MTDAMLRDQVAVVTGGGGGIGFGIARSLARQGARVVIGDILPERAKTAEAELRAVGVEAVGVVMDVMDTDQVRALVATADERFGRIDILVNNAGGTARKAFIEQSERSWRRHIDINLISMMAATAEAAPIMIRGGRGGSIINVSSIEASRAAPGYAVYSACKAAMENFSRTLALELAEHQIRVNCIAPDHTVTPGMFGNLTEPVAATAFERPEPVARAFRSIIPLGREGDIDECGDVAVFLASAMSRYVTGVTIPVDGGTWASGGWTRAGGDGPWVLHDALAKAAG
ncbi:MAG: short-chain dehydrogenase [Caulobacteraceae bacterium]|nr:short-chain dehydrogenase [Caulobacteraceae bacterium]